MVIPSVRDISDLVAFLEKKLSDITKMMGAGSLQFQPPLITRRLVTGVKLSFFAPGKKASSNCLSFLPSGGLLMGCNLALVNATTLGYISEDEDGHYLCKNFKCTTRWAALLILLFLPPLGRWISTFFHLLWGATFPAGGHRVGGRRSAGKQSPGICESNSDVADFQECEN